MGYTRLGMGDSLDICRPWLLEPENYTPPVRTPWGGRRIRERIKQGLSSLPQDQGVVGESWEVSVEPDFPSRLEGGRPLASVLEECGERALGREAQRGQTSTALLVKLLDAAQDLSVQIHPTDDYPGLTRHESGKPESWYVVFCEPGAGLYLGFREGVTESQLRDRLRREGDITDLLFFVPVQPGDFLVIRAGTAHAVGRGLTLVEPQHVAPGCRGVTYRYWDWNRRYDASGAPDARGVRRTLHVEDALAVTDWSAPREEHLLAKTRLRAGPPRPQGPPLEETLCGPSQTPQSDDLHVRRLHGTGNLPLASEDALRALTVLSGSIALRGPGFERTVRAGRSAVLPACIPPLAVHLEDAHALLCSVV